MPRLINAVPKYRKHRASGQAIVTIAGQDHYLGPHGTKASKMLYDRLIAEFLSADRRPLLLDETNRGISVVEVLAAFWKHCKSYYVKNGKRTNEVDAFKLIIRDIRSLYGDHPAAEFGKFQCRTLRLCSRPNEANSSMASVGSCVSIQMPEKPARTNSQTSIAKVIGSLPV